MRWGAVAAFAIVTLTYSAYGADLPVKALETTHFLQLDRILHRSTS